MALELKNYDPAVAAGANIGVSVDLTDITDASGNEVIEIDGVTSAVNYLGVQNAATGGNPTLYAGGEADTGLTFENSEGEEIVIMDAAATAVNEVTITNAAASSNPSIAVTGDDTNISLQLTSKGTGLVILGNSGTGTVAAGSATINAQRGIITTTSLTTGTATAATFDLVDNKIGASSQVVATIVGGTNTTGLPVLGQCTVAAAGSATISIVNADSRPAGAALNGTLKIAFMVLN